MKKWFFFFLIGNLGYGQQSESSTFIILRPELLIGKTIPSSSVFPKTKSQYNFGVSLEKRNIGSNKMWERFLNYPTTGISFYYSNFGNEKLLGNSLSLLPFVQVNLNKKETFSTKLALGASYFNKQFHPQNNSTNSAISSKVTWAIQAFLYYDLLNELKIGMGYMHHSNGHTKLPNLGLNSALLSISTNLNLKKVKTVLNSNSTNPLKLKKIGDDFFTLRYGQGFQEFIDYKSHTETVNSLEFCRGVYYKDILKLSVGLTYKFYHHYYNYITNNKLESYYKNAFLKASNVFISVGVEYLMGNVGIDWEGGLNIYKPFFKEHYLLVEPKLNFKYELKKLFLGRLGLKLYAINTSKKPKNNFFIAAHINSNLSQADFTEVSIGLIHRMFKL